MYLGYATKLIAVTGHLLLHIVRALGSGLLCRMSFEFLMWLFMFFGQAALLGRTMYALICLTDLENDFINPFDLSTRLNAWVVPEYVLEIFITVVLLMSGKWLLGGLHVLMSAYIMKLLVDKKLHVDPTEAFKQLPDLKRYRWVALGFHLLSFIFVIYRLIESSILSFLTPEGKQITKKLFQDAAASLTGY